MNLKGKDMRKLYNQLAFFLACLLPAFAFATPVDLSPLTAAVDFSSVTTAVLAIAALLMAVYVAIKGTKIVLHMVRGG